MTMATPRFACTAGFAHVTKSSDSYIFVAIDVNKDTLSTSISFLDAKHLTSYTVQDYIAQSILCMRNFSCDDSTKLRSGLPRLFRCLARDMPLSFQLSKLQRTSNICDSSPKPDVGSSSTIDRLTREKEPQGSSRAWTALFSTAPSQQPIPQVTNASPRTNTLSSPLTSQPASSIARGNVTPSPHKRVSPAPTRAFVRPHRPLFHHVRV
ncbi:hypothetical protein BDV96DRAFT_562619 [Lophiotrema nucula]|uniref:Uncharacterized protein n=1 Tax=Lophiotrema nucula TaxID=690887 RepID=A0A6A5ZSP4_9PLEO|nr:hypothetical protein BDV96DRAFT_562619 [Lophiotrema nucula]